MKRMFFSAVLSLLVSVCFAQDAPVPKPEFTDVPYVWIKGNPELIALSKETPDIKAGMKMAYKFSDVQSKVKIAPGKFSFLVNTGNSMMLSNTKLYKLEVKNKTRDAVVMASGFGKTKMNNGNTIDINTKTLSTDVYELVPSQALEAGEYCITNGMTFYTFSVN